MMSNFGDDNGLEQVESFADLIDSYDAGMRQDIRIGDRVKGEIISIGMDTVFVNTGAKIDGAVEKMELLDEAGEFTHQVGDVLELYVVRMSENEIRLSRALSGVGGMNMLQDAYDGKIPIEGKVTETCKGGFRVEVIKHRAFCPISQIDIKYVEQPDDYVGKTFEFAITILEERGKNIVVSRRELLKKDQEKAQKKFLEEVSEGSVVEGRVTRLMPYGAFVEIFPGLEGMAHISEIGWSRIEKPDEVLSPNDTVKVKIIGIDAEKAKDGVPKISLSVKQAQEDPWDTIEDQFRPGAKIQGTVTRCAPFGAFVKIAPGIEGLVHISEMSYAKRISKAEDVVQPGDLVDVMVKDVNPDNRRISLSIRDAEGDPWIMAEEKYGVRQTVSGTIEKKERFGYFINLEPGITGLLPASIIKKSPSGSKVEKLKQGDLITVTVENVNPEDRKISLSLGETEEDSGDWKKYSANQKTSFGSLGEKLQQALKSQK